MAGGETELDLAKRRVWAGERLVLRQRNIISQLIELGCPTTIADELLGEFEVNLRDHRERLARLTKQT